MNDTAMFFPYLIASSAVWCPLVPLLLIFWGEASDRRLTKASQPESSEATSKGALGRAMAFAWLNIALIAVNTLLGGAIVAWELAHGTYGDAFTDRLIFVAVLILPFIIITYAVGVEFAAGACAGSLAQPDRVFLQKWARLSPVVTLVLWYAAIIAVRVVPIPNSGM